MGTTTKSHRIFTDRYPGTPRITITGTPESDTVILKTFTRQSRHPGPTRRARAMGCGGSMRSVETVTVERGDLSEMEFRLRVEHACRRLSLKHHAPVVDNGDDTNQYRKKLGLDLLPEWGFFRLESDDLLDEQ